MAYPPGILGRWITEQRLPPSELEQKLRQGHDERAITEEVRLSGRVQSAKRNRCVREFLSFVSLMRSAGLFRPDTAVTSQGARVQDRRGADGNHAAHAMPRQIMLDTQFPWILSFFASEHGLEPIAGADSVRDLFAATTVVWSTLNLDGDGVAELNGLPEAVEAATGHVLRAPHDAPVESRGYFWPRLNHDAVAHAFHEIFLEQAGQAYGAAVTQNAERARTGIAKSRNDRTAADEWRRWLELITLYLDQFRGEALTATANPLEGVARQQWKFRARGA